MGGTIKYVEALDDSKPKEMLAAKFQAVMQAKWGHSDHHYCELLCSDDIVSPYFDYDAKIETEATEAELDGHLRLCLDKLQALFGADVNFDVGSVVVLQRHGWCADAKGEKSYKISFRFYVRGYKVKMGRMSKLLTLFEQNGFWDMKVYCATNQKLAIPGGCKGATSRNPHHDARILTVLPGQDAAAALDCLAQLTSDDDQMIDLDHMDDDEDDTGELPIVQAEWESVRSVLEKAGFRNPRYTGHREKGINFTADNIGNDCPCCPHVHDSIDWWIMCLETGQHVVKSYSERCHVRKLGGRLELFSFRDTPKLPSVDQAGLLAEPECPDPLDLVQPLAQMGLTNPIGDWTEDTDGKQCAMVRQHLQHCPACRATHADPLYIIKAVVEGCFCVRNVDPVCQQRLVGFDTHSIKVRSKALEAVFQHPNKELPLATLYVQERRNMIKSDGKVIYQFNRVRWEPLVDPVAQRNIQHWLDDLLQLFNRLLHNEEAFLEACHPKAGAVTKHLHELRKRVRQARELVLGEAASSKLLSAVKREICQPDLLDLMDTNPYLLGCNNGVLDLTEANPFRRSRPEDMVSKTVAYNWVEQPDPEREAEVEETMSQIYPVTAERAMFQLYGGYCLLGHHPEKKLLLLTDARGGWNAKSTVVGALAAVLGHDYSLKGSNAFLYKADLNSETANSHSAGLLAHRGKRLGYWEELDEKRRLDTQLIKDYNGGCPTATGRGVHGKNVEPFEWITKMVLCFNEHGMPDFDFTDEAVVSRLLVLSHRSRFCESDQQYEEEKHNPHTFKARSDMKAKITEWRPYLLRWFAAGCRRYLAEGFNNIPQECLAWKAQLVERQNSVKCFCKERLERSTDPHAYVDRSMLYEAYKTSYPEERNKKTCLGKRKWFQQLQACLGPKDYHERKAVGPENCKQQRRDVWVGWTLAD